MEDNRGNNAQDEYLEESNAFRWWKRRQRKRYLQSALLIIFMEILTIVMIFNGEDGTTPLKDLIFGIVCLVLFGVLAIYLLSKWKRSFQWKIETSYQGTVIEKRRFSMNSKSRRHENKAYYIVAQEIGRAHV